MSGQPEAIRIFVAMPGSTMGGTATWHEIEDIKSFMLEPVAAGIQTQMGRPTTLVIEKDKHTVGGIYSSMYGEAIHADVYIADLTGANANVYLELGVRWALRDSVTVPIVQNVADIRFNVSATRVISYAKMPRELSKAIEAIVAAAVTGLSNATHVDSPVRESLPLVSIPRAELDTLEAEIQRLTDERAEDLLAAGRAAVGARRLDLFRQAIARNPASVDALIAIGVELRRRKEYDEAAEMLQRATVIDSRNPTAWRELGVVRSKNGHFQAAVEALETAVNHDARDAEAWSNLGGALRRLAREDVGRFDRDRLERARKAYEHAAKLSGNDVYPLMNVARIALLLARDAGERTAARAQFARLVHLAQYAVEDTGRGDAWKLFDLADAQALSGDGDAAEASAQAGIDAMGSPEHVPSTLASVFEPLDDLLHAGVLENALAEKVERLCALYKTHLTQTDV